MTSRPYERLTLAVDLDAQADDLALRTAALAAQLGTENVATIYVLEPLPPVMAGASPDAIPPVALQEAENERAAAATQRLKDLVNTAGLNPEAASIRHGAVPNEILKAAADDEASLIVVGTHGRRGLGRLLGSNASAIVHQAEGDVLTIHLEDPDDSA